MTSDPPIAFGEIDCDTHKKTSDRFKVEGYPTLKVFTKGKDEPWDGKGQTEEDELVSSMKKKAGVKNYKELKCDEIEKSVGAYKRNLVHFGPQLDSKGLMLEPFRLFVLTTQQTEWFNYYTAPAECAEKFKMKPGLTTFRLFDESPIQYTGKPEIKAIVDWMKEIGIESLGVLGDDLLEASFAEGYEIMVLFHNNGEKESYFKAFKEATTEIKNMKFAHSGISEGVQREFSDWLGLKAEKDLPAIRVIKPN